MTTEKNEEVVVTPPVEDTTKTEVDFKSAAERAIAIAEEAAKQLEKAEKDKESYKKGMLAKERQLKSLKDQGYSIDEPEEKLTPESIREIVKDVISSKDEKEVEVSGLSKQVAELKTALINRQGLPTSPTGNSTESQEPKPHRWVDAPEVKADFIRRGLDPNKVYENWLATQEK
jgi:hypothetical protein